MAARTVLIGALVGAAVLAGCVTTSRGEPAPLPGHTTDTSAASTPADHGTPTVEVPLDATPYLVDPCAVLDRTQLAGFGVVEPGIPNTEGPLATSVGPQCVWHAEPEVNSTIDVGFITGGDGLGTLYAARAELAYFEETTVQDYPAVFNSRADNRHQGLCNINVGITDSLTFRTADVSDLDAAKTCARAKQVADAVLTTLKGAS
jgi:hypothetical protein